MAKLKSHKGPKTKFWLLMALILSVNTIQQKNFQDDFLSTFLQTESEVIKPVEQMSDEEIQKAIDAGEDLESEADKAKEEQQEK